jgi:recombination protein RecT
MQLITQHQHTNTLRALMKANTEAMLRMAPRSTGDPARLLRIAFNTVAYDDKLSECLTTMPGKASILGGIMEALKLGITLGGPMQEGWLIPFKNQGTPMAQLIVGYQGYRNIIDRGGSVISMQPRAVHVADFEAGHFDYDLGDNPRIHFRPQHPQPEKKEDLYCVFMVAHLRRGGKQIDLMFIPEIESHRLKSRARESGPWKDYYVPMAMKTIVRKMSKYLPKSNELLARALDLDNKADSGEPQDFEMEGLTVPEDEKPTAQRPKALEALKDKLGVTEPAKAEKVAVGQTAPPEPPPEMTVEDFGGFGQ